MGREEGKVVDVATRQTVKMRALAAHLPIVSPRATNVIVEMDEHDENI